MSARGEAEGLKYGLALTAKAAETLELSTSGLGQRNPQHCPPLLDAIRIEYLADPLGEPMNIGQVARFLGCSAWTVRQRYLPSGLPYFRLGSTGKLLFYRNQIVLWILEKQKQRQKGRR